jgi:replicative DNA helicase
MTTTEQALVGAMLIDPSVCDVAYDLGVTRECLSDRTVIRIFDAVMALWQGGKRYDALSVQAEGRKRGYDLTLESMTEMRYLVLEQGGVEHASLYAQMILDDHRDRTVRTKTEDILNRYRLNPDGDYIPELAAIFAPTSGQQSTGGWFSQIVPEVADKFERRANGELPQPFIPTGYPALDDNLQGGLYESELIIVGARPGIGKTIFGLGVAMNAARSGKRVAFFSAEMTMEATLRRAASEHTSIPAWIGDGTHHGLTDDQCYQQRQFIASMRHDLSQLPIYGEFKSRPTTAFVRNTVDQHGPFDLIVFDYLGLAGDIAKGDNEERRISKIAQGFMDIAKETTIPVLCLCQLSREVEKSPPYIPAADHLRYSGDIEACAHKILMLYRHDHYVSVGKLPYDATKQNQLDIYVIKNRENHTDMISLEFDGSIYTLRGKQ